MVSNDKFTVRFESTATVDSEVADLEWGFGEEEKVVIGFKADESEISFGVE